MDENENWLVFDWHLKGAQSKLKEMNSLLISGMEKAW